jgi:hypothetical protein
LEHPLPNHPDARAVGERITGCPRVADQAHFSLYIEAYLIF